MNKNRVKIILLSWLLGMVGTASALEVTSADIVPDRVIGRSFVYNGFGCDGLNFSPALSWKGAPAQTKSYAVLVHDPDAPTGGAGWWHWLVYNILADVTALPQGAGLSDGSAMVKGAVQAITDFGKPGWGGPCPPLGDQPHHYHFTVHALKVDRLDIPMGSTAALVGFMINASTIEKATLTGIYGR